MKLLIVTFCIFLTSLQEVSAQLPENKEILYSSLIKVFKNDFVFTVFSIKDIHFNEKCDRLVMVLLTKLPDSADKKIDSCTWAMTSLEDLFFYAPETYAVVTEFKVKKRKVFLKLLNTDGVPDYKPDKTFWVEAVFSRSDIDALTLIKLDFITETNKYKKRIINKKVKNLLDR